VVGERKKKLIRTETINIRSISGAVLVVVVPG